MISAATLRSRDAHHGVIQPCGVSSGDYGAAESIFTAEKETIPEPPNIIILFID